MGTKGFIFATAVASALFFVGCKEQPAKNDSAGEAVHGGSKEWAEAADEARKILNSGSDQNTSATIEEKTIETVDNHTTEKAEEKAEKANKTDTKKTKLSDESSQKEVEAVSGPEVPFGTYSGPASGVGGEITVKSSYTLDLKKGDGSSLHLKPGDKIRNVRIKNGEIKQGVWVHDGESEFFTR